MCGVGRGRAAPDDAPELLPGGLVALWSSYDKFFSNFSQIHKAKGF